MNFLHRVGLYVLHLNSRSDASLFYVNNCEVWYLYLVSFGILVSLPYWYQ